MKEIDNVRYVMINNDSRHFCGYCTALTTDAQGKKVSGGTLCSKLSQGMHWCGKGYYFEKQKENK